MTDEGKRKLTEFSWDELLAEVKRRVDYDMRGWQESYASAQYWRERCGLMEDRIEKETGERPETTDAEVRTHR